MNKLSPETIEKLEWLKGRLRKYPHRYDQRNYCGTQACLAGLCWPRMIGSKGITISGWMKDAAYAKLKSDLITSWTDWLNVSDSAAMRLFSEEWWGRARKFNRLQTDTDEQAAEKACQRIDLFIQSGGTQ